MKNLTARAGRSSLLLNRNSRVQPVLRRSRISRLSRRCRDRIPCRDRLSFESRKVDDQTILSFLYDVARA